MSDMLKERIDILKTSGVIDRDVANFVTEVIDDFSSKHFDEGKMEMFTTHLAMAIERIKKNEPVETLDDIIWNDVKNNENFENATKLFKVLSAKSPVTITDSEERFLLMHICNLLQN